MTKYDILVEELGGEVQFSKLSAKKGLGIEDLLDKILLQVLFGYIKIIHDIYSFAQLQF